MTTNVSPLPDSAKRVFKGEIFEIWQWPQQMYDGSTHTFERVKRPNTVQVIAVIGDQILVQEQQQPDRSRPYFSFPGGRCDAEEQPLKSAQRELLEETGLTSSDWELWSERRPVTKMEWIIYTYIARNCVKEKEPRLDAGEKITNRLINFNEFLRLPDDPDFYDSWMAIMLVKAQHNPAAADKLRRQLFQKV